MKRNQTVERLTGGAVGPADEVDPKPDTPTQIDESQPTDSGTKLKDEQKGGYEPHQEVPNLESDSKDDDIVFLVDGLGKVYNGKITAVHDVSFTGLRGECFGLLGVNGSGKSTTFSMLCGTTFPSKGNATVICSTKYYSIEHYPLSFVKNIGYCPQDYCLIDILTARQLMFIFANLRGVTVNNVSAIVDWWIQNLDLHIYCDKPCGTYSGGNKRKLSTALALIGQPKVILLDEPTTGVDPVTRRKLWHVFRLIKQTDQTMILTSHSMDECEAVCSKLTIMVAGRMKCLGEIQYLKKKFALGYTIQLKINVDTEESVVAEIKEKMVSTFGSECLLIDEHKGFLQFSVGELKFQWSQVFQKMEAIKKSLNAVEEYMLSDTSLDQVFLTFAREAKHPRTEANAERNV